MCAGLPAAISLNSVADRPIYFVRGSSPPLRAPHPMPAPASIHISSATASLAGKYLSVLVEHEACAIAFSAVREIVRVQRIAPPPPASRHLKGVIELRGRAIPVVDLREKFGLKAEFAERACIVVVATGPSSTPVGLIVDGVEETFTLATGEIEPAPDLGAKISTDFLLGTAHVRGRSKLILDLGRVVAADAFAAMAEAI